MTLNPSVTYNVKYGEEKQKITFEFSIDEKGYCLEHPTNVHRRILNPDAEKMLQVLHTAAQKRSYGSGIDLKTFSKKNVKPRKDITRLEKHLKNKWKKKFPKIPPPFDQP